MNKFNIKKYIIIFICISLISMTSIDFILLHRHDYMHCNSSECTLCTHLEQFQQKLKFLNNLTDILLESTLITYFIIVKLFKEVIINITPISLKVRMDN